MDIEHLPFLEPLYHIVAAVLTIVVAIIGLIGLVIPAWLRVGVKAVRSKAVLRMIGAALVVTGVIMLIWAYQSTLPYTFVWPWQSVPPHVIGWVPHLAFPRLAFVLGVLTFLKGAAYLLFPVIIGRVIDFHVARSNAWQRLLGIICLAFAFLFFMAWT